MNVEIKESNTYLGTIQVLAVIIGFVFCFFFLAQCTAKVNSDPESVSLFNSCDDFLSWENLKYKDGALAQIKECQMKILEKFDPNGLNKISSGESN